MERAVIDLSVGELFHRFCSTSTIHGTYFWGESRSIIGRCVWYFIVTMGIACSSYFIYKHNLSWQKQPVVTSVKQIAIEEVHFPAITICPLDHTRYNSNNIGYLYLSIFIKRVIELIV